MFEEHDIAGHLEITWGGLRKDHRISVHKLKKRIIIAIELLRMNYICGNDRSASINLIERNGSSELFCVTQVLFSPE